MSDRPPRWGLCYLPQEPLERYCLPNSRIMLHQPSGGFQGQASDIEIHAREILNLRRRLNEIYVHHTGQDYETIERAVERDNFMSAEDALEFGLIDKVETARVDWKKPEISAAIWAVKLNFFFRAYFALFGAFFGTETLVARQGAIVGMPAFGRFVVKRLLTNRVQSFL